MIPWARSTPSTWYPPKGACNVFVAIMWSQTRRGLPKEGGIDDLPPIHSPYMSLPACKGTHDIIGVPHSGLNGPAPTGGADTNLSAHEGNKRTTRTAHSTARSFLGFCFTHFWLIFSVAETRWLEGFRYNNGGLHSILLTIAMVVVAAHTPCRGGAVELKETSSARPTTEEGAPHGCPSLRSIRFDTFRVSNLTGY